MTATLDLTTATPAEIDQEWLEAVKPAVRFKERAHAKFAQATRYRKSGGRYIEDADRYDNEGMALMAEAGAIEGTASRPFREEWDRRGGWTRAYLVPDGHIHRSTSCHTLYPTTLISWLPEQSGWDEEKIVEAAGIMACTVCYPTAPVEALRAAEAAAKAEAECPGSRSFDYDQATWRQTSYTGTGHATCRQCGERVGTSKTGKMRAHKRAGA